MRRMVPVVLAASLGWTPQVQRDRAIPRVPVGTAAIAGRVLIEVSGSPQPVRRARLTLESDALPTAQTTDTDIEGRYRFESLAAGAYYVRAEKAGLVRLVRDLRRTFERPAPVELEAARIATHDLWMVRGAALEGQILLDSGAPAVNVIVSAVRFAYDANGRRPVAVRQARTDDRGRFRVHSFARGRVLPGRRTRPARRPTPGLPQPAAGQQPSRADTTQALRALKVGRPYRSQPARTSPLSTSRFRPLQAWRCEWTNRQLRPAHRSR